MQVIWSQTQVEQLRRWRTEKERKWKVNLFIFSFSCIISTFHSQLWPHFIPAFLESITKHRENVRDLVKIAGIWFLFTRFLFFNLTNTGRNVTSYLYWNPARGPRLLRLQCCTGTGVNIRHLLINTGFFWIFLKGETTLTGSFLPLVDGWADNLPLSGRQRSVIILHLTAARSPSEHVGSSEDTVWKKMPDKLWFSSFCGSFF